MKCPKKESGANSFRSLLLARVGVLLGWMSEPLFKGVVDSCTICLGDDEPLSKRSCCSKPICVPCMTKWFEQSQRMLAASASAGAGAASSTSPSSSSSSTSGRSRSRAQSRASSGQKKGAGSSDDTQTVVCPQCRETIPVPNGKIQQDDYMTTVRDTLCTRSDTFDSRFSGECAFVWMCGCVDVCVCLWMWVSMDVGVWNQCVSVVRMHELMPVVGSLWLNHRYSQHLCAM